MESRRSFLGLCAAGLAVGIAGCNDVVPTSFEAAPATINEETLSETGYSEVDSFDETLEQDVDVLGSEREIEVVNEIALYGKEVELGGQTQEGAVAGLVSTPQMLVEGQAFNPIQNWDATRLVDEFVPRVEGRQQFGSIRNLTEEGEDSVSILGAERTITRFEGEADIEQTEEPVDIVLHTSAPISSGSDFIIAAGGYPAPLAGTEEEPLFSLFGGIEHS